MPAAAAAQSLRAPEGVPPAPGTGTTAGLAVAQAAAAATRPSETPAPAPAPAPAPHAAAAAAAAGAVPAAVTPDRSSFTPTMQLVQRPSYTEESASGGGGVAASSLAEMATLIREIQRETKEETMRAAAPCVQSDRITPRIFLSLATTASLGWRVQPFLTH